MKLNAVFLSHFVLSLRTNTLLEKVAAAVDQSAFYSALWGSLLTSPAVRLPGITYVLAHLNRKLSMEDQLYIIGSDIELMVCLCMIAHITYSFRAGHTVPDRWWELCHNQSSCFHGTCIFHQGNLKTKLVTKCCF